MQQLEHLIRSALCIEQTSIHNARPGVEEWLDVLSSSDIAFFGGHCVSLHFKTLQIIGSSAGPQKNNKMGLLCQMTSMGTLDLGDLILKQCFDDQAFDPMAWFDLGRLV